MIFSQLIANGIIIVAALSSNWKLATILYLIKESFNDLDIPTSYDIVLDNADSSVQVNMHLDYEGQSIGSLVCMHRS